MDNKTEIFLEYKPLLFSIAYNMLGTVDGAEDMVQDAYLKWMDAEATAVRYPKAFLVKVVTNQCINHLGSARVKREAYIGLWLPEPLQNYDPVGANAKVESYQALSIGMLVLMEKLTPQERAVFLLKEVFSYDYQEIADIFDKTTDNCRQILKRAKEHLGKDTRRFQVDMAVHEKILQNFLKALQEGDVEGLIHLLVEDVVMLADGGGKSVAVGAQRLAAYRKPIEGRKNVCNALLKTAPKFRRLAEELNLSRYFTLTNGLPSVISFEGSTPFSLMTLDTDGEQIRNIYVQTNPDKLKHFTKP